MSKVQDGETEEEHEPEAKVLGLVADEDHANQRAERAAGQSQEDQDEFGHAPAVMLRLEFVKSVEQ